MSNKKKELIRSLKFVLFSISAGVIQIVSFTLLTAELLAVLSDLAGAFGRLQLYDQPKIHLSFRRERSDRDAEGFPVLLRVHAAFDDRRQLSGGDASLE